MAHNYYEINNDDVVSEVIDGEAIIINMMTGSYFSLDNTGSAVWESLLRGPASIDTLSQILSQKYEGDKTQFDQELSRLIAEMESHGIVKKSEAEIEREIMKSAGSPSPFLPPVLQVYTDLEELLLLDPIHAVTPEGWPNKNTDEE